MKKCNRLNEILQQTGDELTYGAQAAMAEHARHCSHCQDELRRLTRTCQVVADVVDNDSLTAGPCLNDLKLAAFACSGYEAQQADRIVTHLARCESCRGDLVAVRGAMEQCEDILTPRDTSSIVDEVASTMHVAFSSTHSALLAVGGVLAYLLGCVLFALALAHVWLAWFSSVPGFDAVPTVFPFALISPEPLRLGAFILVCAIGAVVMRAIAIRLFDRALK